LSIIKLPNYHVKQKKLYIDKTSPEVLRAYGDAFAAAGNISDALDFYQKANFTEGLQKIKDKAMADGDVMIFQAAAKALKNDLQPACWEAIGERAIALKKYFFARHAFGKANNEERLEALTKIMEAEAH
jgi:hypothetical protein